MKGKGIKRIGLVNNIEKPRFLVVIFA